MIFYVCFVLTMGYLQYLFNNLEQARKVTEEWLTIYNTERPHEALNNMTPIEYKTLKQAA